MPLLTARRQPPGTAISKANANNNYLQFGDHAGAKLLEGASDLTIEVCYLIASTSGWQGPCGKTTSGGGDGWFIEWENAGNPSLGGTGIPGGALAGHTGRVINVWYYLAYRLIGGASGTWQAYYGAVGTAGGVGGSSGLVVGSATASAGAIPATTGAMLVGGSLAFTNEQLNGRVAFCRLWNRALSESELRGIWDRHLLRRAYPGLVFHWDSVWDGPRGANLSRELTLGTVATVTGTVTRDTRPPPLGWAFDEPRWRIAVLGGADSGGGGDPPATLVTRKTLLGVGV